MARISTRRAYAYGKIVQSIRTGVFKPGDRLIESNLCEMMGLSRVPVREALFQLASEGLVEHAPGLGAIVSCPDRQEILDLFELREVLEGHVAYRAAEIATQSDIERLEEICRRMHGMLRSAMDAREWGDQQRATMFAVDMDFHDTLSRIAGNGRISAQIQSLHLIWKIVVFDPRFPAASNWHMRTWAWGYHVRILRAIKQRNAQAARDAMIAHIRVSRPFAIRAQAALWELSGRIETFYLTVHPAMNDSRPILGITMGDPAGIGPEIIVKALAHSSVFDCCRPVVIGDEGAMRRALQFMQSDLQINILAKCGEAQGRSGTLDLLPVGGLHLENLALGKVSAAAGEAGFACVRRSIELAMSGDIAGVVTTPINKEALHLAGHKFPGHTEIFAHFTGTTESVMMLAHGHFRVAHVSTHVSLKEAVARVKKDRVFRVIELAAEACREVGIADPLVAVAGLNPHAGEGGLFGDEEIREIIPAIQAARACGIRCEGPFPADTLFPKAAGGGGKGAIDICIAMFHDQGHVAVKMRGFEFSSASGAWSSVRGINVSLGLPIVRVSVDHGTAFDQAGRGTASEASLIDAIEYAAAMARHRALRSVP